MPQVSYGDALIDVEQGDIPLLIASLAVASNPTNPQQSLDEASLRVPEFADERETLYGCQADDEEARTSTIN